MERRRVRVHATDFIGRPACDEPVSVGGLQVNGQA